ncbi:MAG: PepSY domain-containing protein [Candidatus Spyradosoma sp.]
MNLQKICLTAHLYATLFFLPLLCAFALTGALYLCGVRTTETVETVELPGVAARDYEAAKKALEERGVAVPAEFSVRKGVACYGSAFETHVRFPEERGGGFGRGRRAADAQDVMRAEIVTPGLFDRLMLVHKGKAGTYFRVLAVGAGAAMLVAYLSGLVFAWKNKARRRSLAVSFVLGVLACAAGFLLV